MKELEKRVIETVDDILHYVCVSELDKAQLLLETLKELLTNNPKEI